MGLSGTIISVENITTNIETGITSVTLIENKLPITTIVEESIEISMIELGVQGPPGPKGDALQFSMLTEQQKLELRGDIGDMSTNYTNLFNSVLLS